MARLARSLLAMSLAAAFVLPGCGGGGTSGIPDAVVDTPADDPGVPDVQGDDGVVGDRVQEDVPPVDVPIDVPPVDVPADVPPPDAPGDVPPADVPCGPGACDDENACTVDTCTPATGACTHAPVQNGTACDDHDPGTAGDACMQGACQGIPVGPTPCRVTGLTLVSPTVTFGFPGDTPEPVNELIGAYLTAALSELKQGGAVGLFDPLVLGAVNATLRFGEGLCATDAAGKLSCNLLPGGHSAAFPDVAYAKDGVCAVGSLEADGPCFSTSEPSFDVHAMMPEIFPADVGSVTALAVGAFDALPPTAIPGGQVSAFVPKAVGMAAVGTRTVNLSGQDVTLASILETVPTTTNADGTAGWQVVMGFTAECVPLLDLASDCNGIPGRCDDGIACTLDRCLSWTECQHTLAPGTCFVGGACYAEGQPDPTGPCRTCQSVLAADRFLADDLPACDDGDACTLTDHCSDGACVGTPVNCDDGEPCTLDTCANGTCRHEPWTGACNDGDLCTRNDSCADGTCKGDAFTCADDNACTDDTCDPTLGCVFTPNATPCDDGNLCTVGDHCAKGACAAGEDRLGCDDGNPCTDDGCVPAKGCVHIPNSVPCDDHDACTLDDTCGEAECQAGRRPLACDDGNLCTDDSCDPDTGCVNAANTVPCDDHDACTVGDTCGGKACLPGTGAPDCDDANPCTDDSCDGSLGCVHVANTAPCNDGDPCRGDDACRDTVCTPGPTVLDCNDDNPCTDEICVANTGCVRGNNTLPCDDGDPCLSGDTCLGGACRAGTIELDCNDENLCTDDSCTPNLGCSHGNNTLPCDDHSMCTEGDTCDGGACLGAEVYCNDGRECTLDSCDPAVGCVFTPDSLNPACRPVILFTYPPRAATLNGPRDIAITGFVHSLGGFITNFVINYNGVDHVVDVSPFDGSFALPVTSEQGVNVIVADAVDQLGFKDHGVRTYAYSTTWYPIDAQNPDQSRVPDGMGINLGAAVWDDGDRADTDSIADVLAMYVKTLDLSSMVGGAPMTGACQYGCNYKITITSVDFDRNNVGLTITPVNGGLQLEATLYSLVAHFHADMSNGGCAPWFCVLGDFDGTITVSWVRAVTTVLISVDPATGEPVVTNGGTTVTMADPVLDTDNWLVNLLKSFFIASLKSALIDAFQDAIGGVMGDTLGDALKMLNIHQVLTIDPLLPGGAAVDVTLDAKLGSALFDPAGGALGMKTTATAPTGTTHTPLGSIGRASCLSGTPEPFALPRAYPLEIALHDDVLNQVVYGIYWGGGLAFPLGPDTVGDLSAYGVTDVNLFVDFLLPPILTACNPEAALKAQLGDISVAGDLRLFGSLVTVQMYATALADASVAATDGELSVTIGALTFADIEIESLAGGLAGGEDLLQNLVKQTLLPSLLGGFAGKTLGSFPIPSIPLDGMGEGIPPGTAISIDLQQVSRVFGYTVAQGIVKQ